MQTAAAPTAPAATTLSRGSAWVGGVTGSPDYYTIGQHAALNYPDSDWAEIFMVKLNRVQFGITQHLFSSGQYGAGTNSTVALYLSGTVLVARIRTSSAQTVTGLSAITPGFANNTGWFIICVRRVGANIQIVQVPLNGTAVQSVSTAVTALAAITPNAGITIGVRSDVVSTTHTTKNQFSWYARVNGTITDGQLESLAAGQDIMADLGLSPLAYINFNSSAATIADSSGNGRTATKVGAPALRGGPTFTGAPVTISSTFDALYGHVFQRAPGGTTKAITATGTYKGSPGSILVRVIDKSGTQVVAPVTATTPSAGNWTATLTVPQGGEYTLEAYHKADNTKIARSQLPWGVGMIVMLSGESIAQGQASGSAWTDSASADYPGSVFAPNVENTSVVNTPDAWLNNTAYTLNGLITDTADNTFWKVKTGHTSPASGTFAADRIANPSRWEQVTLPALQTDNLNNSAGSIMHTIDRLRIALGIPVMALFVGKTGSTLVGGTADWGSPYTNVNTHGKVKAGLANTGGDVEAIIHVQGANDGNSASVVSLAAYQAAEEALIPQIRSYIPGRTAAQLPVFIPITGINSSGTSPNGSNWRNVRSGTRAAIANLANTYDCGEMYDLPHADALHPNAAGYVRLSKREAQALLNYYQPLITTTGMRGADVASASYSGNDILVNFTLPAGATTLKGLTGNTAFTGLSIKNASAVAKTVSSSALADADTLTATMGEAVGAGWTVDYIDIQNPTITNPIYDDRPVIGDTAGVPVRSWNAAITL